MFIALAAAVRREPKSIHDATVGFVQSARHLGHTVRRAYVALHTGVFHHRVRRGGFWFFRDRGRSRGDRQAVVFHLLDCIPALLDWGAGAASLRDPLLRGLLLARQAECLHANARHVRP